MSGVMKECGEKVDAVLFPFQKGKGRRNLILNSNMIWIIPKSSLALL